MTKNNLIDNLTEEEKADMEDKAQEIRDYAIGLGLALEQFYDEYGINEWQMTFDYLKVKERQVINRGRDD